jgi:hypothetical protein
MSINSGSLRGQSLIRSLFTALLLSAGCLGSVHAAETTRPTNWANAISGVEGMGNLFQVSPELYRSKQPSSKALQNMLAGKAFVDGNPPVHTIVELLATHDVDAETLGASSAVHHTWLKFNPFRPTDEDVLTFLRVVTDKGSQPVLVHCAQGSDRTGMMVAIYRIVVQGWSKDDALKEMVEGGYGFHAFWQDLVRYVRNLDVDSLKTRLAAAGPWQEGAGAIAQNTKGVAPVTGAASK